MKKFKHVRRSGVLFIILTPLTLLIYPWVVLAHVRKEVNSMTEGRPEFKKSIPCFWAFFLGLFTLFIVPLVWLARLAKKIRRLSEEHEVSKPYVSPAWMVCWLIFGSLILIGPFLAYCRFFRNLNRLEKKLNEEADAPQEEPSLEEPADEPIEGGADEFGAGGEPAPEQPGEEPAPVPELEGGAPEEEPAPELPHEPEVYETLPPEKRKYRVRMEKGKKVYRYFETKEEAIAYAKGLARSRGVNVVVK